MLPCHHLDPHGLHHRLRAPPCGPASLLVQNRRTGRLPAVTTAPQLLARPPRRPRAAHSTRSAAQAAREPRKPPCGPSQPALKMRRSPQDADDPPPTHQAPAYPSRPPPTHQAPSLTYQARGDPDDGDGLPGRVRIHHRLDVRLRRWHYGLGRLARAHGQSAVLPVAPLAALARPGSQCFGSGLLHALWESASVAQTTVAADGAAVSLRQSCSFCALSPPRRVSAAIPSGGFARSDAPLGGA